MKSYIKKSQVVAIHANKYTVLFADTDLTTVKRYAKDNRAKLKKEGAQKVIINIGFYEIITPQC